MAPNSCAVPPVSHLLRPTRYTILNNEEVAPACAAASTSSSASAIAGAAAAAAQGIAAFNVAQAANAPSLPEDSAHLVHDPSLSGAVATADPAKEPCTAASAGAGTPCVVTAAVGANPGGLTVISEEALTQDLMYLQRRYGQAFSQVSERHEYRDTVHTHVVHTRLQIVEQSV